MLITVSSSITRPVTNLQVQLLSWRLAESLPTGPSWLRWKGEPFQRQVVSLPCGGLAHALCLGVAPIESRSRIRPSSTSTFMVCSVRRVLLSSTAIQQRKHKTRQPPPAGFSAFRLTRTWRHLAWTETTEPIYSESPMTSYPVTWPSFPGSSSAKLRP